MGEQYRSAIFYYSDQQKEIAEHSKAGYAAKLWDNPIVTEIVPAAEFYIAEDYHQNYYKDNPQAGYCRVIINPKVRKAKEKFADLYPEAQ